jgi:RNA polymerase sigma factor (sigma-70 family)
MSEACPRNLADLLRACGENPRADNLWESFRQRVLPLILTYVMRSIHHGESVSDRASVVQDLAQEVCLRLVQHRANALRTFRGDTDMAVFAFLAKTAMTVVTDHYRAAGCLKRHTTLVPHDADAADAPRAVVANEAAILAMVDLERSLGNVIDRHADRNLLLLKLYYLEGFTAEELAEHPAFHLSASGIEKALQRLKQQLQSASRTVDVTGVRDSRTQCAQAPDSKISKRTP